MKPFLKWLDEDKFYIRQSYNFETDEWQGAGHMELTKNQRRILGEALLLDENNKFKYETIIYSCPKKSGKTAVNAAVMAWMAEMEQDGSEIYILANDLDAAEGRVMRDIKYHFEVRQEKLNDQEPGLGKKYCKVTQYRIDFHATGTFVQCLAQSFKSVAGSRHCATGWDELWTYTTERSRRTWDELTPIPTVPRSIRFISTYAGFENESDLLWDKYLQGVDSEEHPEGRGEKIPGLEDLAVYASGMQFTYWDHEPSMPWQTDKYYEEQLENERPAAYLRFHENQWVTSHSEFIPVEWWDKACAIYPASADMWSEHPMANYPVSIGIDAGIKRDSTALVAVAYDSARGRIGMIAHKIWIPSKDHPIDLEATVEFELQRLYNKYNVVSIACDPTFLHRTITEFKKKDIVIKEYAQAVGPMTKASQVLYDTLRNSAFEAYPDDIARKQMQMAAAVETPGGFRIVKPKTSSKHFVDFAIALAIAVHTAISSGGVDVTIPLVIPNPYTDEEFNVDDIQLPFPLRT